jgi:hypothetical protein
MEKRTLATLLLFTSAIAGSLIAAENKAVDSTRAGRRADGSIPLSAHWTLERLLAMSHEDTMALWKTLPPVPVKELHGHYTGLVPNAGDPKRQAGMADYMYSETSVRGYWLGKVYKQTGENAGEGYNMWRFPGGKVVRNLRFSTHIGKSLIDDQPSLLMHYGAYSKSTLTDELRKVEDGVYIGAATTEARDGKRTQPDHFFLVGPIDEWVDIEPAAPSR